MRKSVVSGKLVLYETDGIISCRSDENNKKDNLDELATLLFQFAGFRLNNLLLNDNFMLEVYI